MRPVFFLEVASKIGTIAALAAMAGTPAFTSAQDFSESITRSIKPLAEPSPTEGEPGTDTKLQAIAFTPPEQRLRQRG